MRLNKLKAKLITKLRMIFNPKRVSLHGVKIDLSGLNISPSLARSFYEGSYERQEIGVLKKVLDQSNRVMELGAGIGLISTYCAKIVGSDKVVAYEANPSMINHIQTTYRNNKVQVKVINAILGDSNGEVEFYASDDFWVSSTKQRQNAKRVLVRTLNVNEEIDLYKPDTLIIDIEGGEKELFSVINLDYIHKILIELHPEILNDSDITSIVERLIQEGFKLSLKHSDGNVYFFHRLK